MSSPFIKEICQWINILRNILWNMLFRSKNKLHGCLITRGKTQLVPVFKKGINRKDTEMIYDTSGQQYDWASGKNSQDASLNMWSSLISLHRSGSSTSLDHAVGNTPANCSRFYIQKLCWKATTFLSTSIPEFLGKGLHWPNLGWVSSLRPINCSQRIESQGIGSHLYHN